MKLTLDEVIEKFEEMVDHFEMACPHETEQIKVMNEALHALKAWQHLALVKEDLEEDDNERSIFTASMLDYTWTNFYEEEE